MENMNDLNDLLKHEIQDLYSAEEQILEALPKMVDKAKHPELKKALNDHLKVTREHIKRLDKVQQMLNVEETGGKKERLLSRLFKSSHKCKGMEGLIEEGESIMSEDMSQEVLDAAIIASAQKIEHYEICAYGTTRTYARELGMEDVARILEQTLNEEYYSDDLLTELAESRINQKAEKAGSAPHTRESRATTSRQRVGREEPEMEMASQKRGTSASRPATGSPRGSNSSRSTTSSGRSASSSNASRRNTSGTRSESRSTRSTSGGRGSSSSRGRNR